MILFHRYTVCQSLLSRYCHGLHKSTNARNRAIEFNCYSDFLTIFPNTHKDQVVQLYNRTDKIRHNITPALGAKLNQLDSELLP